MSIRKTSSFFFCAATLAFSASVNAENTTTITTIDVWNLNGNAEKTVAATEKLVIHQEIDGIFSGNFSGSGAVEKQGDAGLTLTGGITLPSGNLSVTAGTLTLADGVSFHNPDSPSSPGQFYIYNSASVVLAQNNDFSSQLVISDSEKTGTVSSIGTGKVTVSDLSGNILNVNAGTLIVSGTTAFKTISVLSGATLQIGTGDSASLAGLSGNVALEKSANLIFNRKADNTSPEYSGTISGNGDVTFNGTQIFYFADGKNQTYTGTTTVNAGGLVFRRATQTGPDGNIYYNPNAVAAKIASPEISVNAGGTFGGHATVAGNVTVSGTDFASSQDWIGKFGQGTFGSWHLGAGTLFAGSGDVLTINGDLKIAPTKIQYYFPTETTIDYSGTSGGALQVNFGAMGAGKIIANGNVELGGSLILVGSDGIAPGQVSVFFESDPAKTKGTFDQIVYGSENVTLLLPGVAGIREGQYGIATTENRNVRKRASFDEHEGLSAFTDYLVANANGMNKIAQAVSLADADSVTNVVNNFSALPYSAFAEMALRQSDSELDMILQNVARAKKTPPTSEDGVRVPANFAFFSGIVTDFVNHKERDDLPVYDFDSVGVFAGGYSWIDDERIAGASLGIHRSSAKPHGGGGMLGDAAVRAKLFAVFAPKFSNWFLTIGGSFGAHYYEADRETALGKNFGDTDGVDAGLFVAFNYRTELEKDLFFTPYMRLEYNFSYVGGIEESGSGSRLEVEHIITNTYSVRVGSGVEYTGMEGRIFGVDFGLIGTLGERPSITSEFIEYSGSRTRIKGTNGDPVSVEIAPRFSLDFGDGWNLDAVYRLQCPFSGDINHSFGIGLSKKF